MLCHDGVEQVMTFAMLGAQVMVTFAWRALSRRGASHCTPNCLYQSCLCRHQREHLHLAQVKIHASIRAWQRSAGERDPSQVIGAERQ